MKYRKKPVVIEAEIYKPGMEDGLIPTDEAIWINVTLAAKWIQVGVEGIPYINTLEGKHFITPGDYIVTGIKGERYPVKADIFNATYEPVEVVKCL